MVIYFILTFACSRLLRMWEKRMDGSDNYDLATTDTLAHTSGLYKYTGREEDAGVSREEVIRIHHLSKTFGKNVVLRDIDFSVCAGDVTCIIGASGSGKSTLLRCLNLLETPTTGEVYFHGQDIIKERHRRGGLPQQGRHGFSEL